MLRGGAGSDNIVVADAALRMADGGAGLDKLIFATGGAAFDSSDTRNTTFTAAGTHNSLVIEGNAGDRLVLETGGANAGAAWQRVASDVGLDGTAGGLYDLFALLDSGSTLASVAVGRDVVVTDGVLIL